jgi:3-hydroxybutyryl-CoA dehydrogenase
VGADINLAASEQIATAMGHHPRYHVFAALRAQVASGDLGRKTGRGFVTGRNFPVPASPDASIALRIEAMVANEAATLLAEGGVAATDIDRALTLGLNFPRGAFGAARVWGAARIKAELTRLQDHAPEALKPRYQMSSALKEALRHGDEPADSQP